MKVYPFGAPDAIDVTGAVDRAGHAHCGRGGGAMKDTYLAKDFRATAARRFPAKAAALNAAFDARLQALRADNAAAGKEKQILPGIAAYETLQTVMPKEEALQTVHGYVEQRARRMHRYLAAMLRLPGLYRLVPGIFVKSTRTLFGPAAGFAATELKTDQGTWRIDMTRCPYHDTCVEYGCPELCPCFCGSIRQRRALPSRGRSAPAGGCSCPI